MCISLLLLKGRNKIWHIKDFGIIEFNPYFFSLLLNRDQTFVECHSKFLFLQILASCFMAGLILAYFKSLVYAC